MEQRSIDKFPVLVLVIYNVKFREEKITIKWKTLLKTIDDRRKRKNLEGAAACGDVFTLTPIFRSCSGSLTYQVAAAEGILANIEEEWSRNQNTLFTPN